MNQNDQYNASQDLSDLLFAMQQKNLVYNYNFLYYSNKVVETAVTYNHPDGWLYKDNGDAGQIGFEPSTDSCLIKKSSGDSMMTFKQNINEFPRWKKILLKQKVSACAIVQNPGISFDLTFSLSDGIDTSSKTIKFNKDEKKEIFISIDVNNNANNLELSLSSSTSDAVIYIQKIYANIGKVAIESLPCIVEGFIGERKQYMSTENPPAEELSLCMESKELPSTYTRLSSFLNGKFGIGEGPDGRSFLPDMRGYFSRAWDNGAKTDPDADDRTALGKGTVKGDNVGTVEKDEFKSHDHDLTFGNSGKVSPGTGAPPLTIISPAPKSKTEPKGGKETRSKNIAELYTMKWA